MKRTFILLFAVLVIGAGLSETVLADTSAFYVEGIGLIGYSQEEEWLGEKDRALVNSVGFKYLYSMDDDMGDFLNWKVQARIGYDSSGLEEDRFYLAVHDAWVEYKPWVGHGFVAGHFAPSFGLEAVVDTDGELFQTLAVPDIGFKEDWGVGYRYSADTYDAEASVQIGTGMPLEREEGSYLATCRVSIPTRNAVWGVSVLRGEIVPGGATRTLPYGDLPPVTVMKTRLGVDAEWDAKWTSLRAELTAGWNEDRETLGALVQADSELADLPRARVTAQAASWADVEHREGGRLSYVGMGLSYKLSESLEARAAVFSYMDHPAGEDTQAFLQLYYSDLF